MTRFLDGPAKGQILMLKRTPIFLRVVYAYNKWDALDQPGDTPKPEESIWAYQTPGSHGMACVRPGGYYPMANYTMVLNPPDNWIMRERAAWEEWCEKRWKETHP